MNRRIRRVNQAIARLKRGESIEKIAEEMNLTKSEFKRIFQNYIESPPTGLIDSQDAL